MATRSGEGQRRRGNLSVARWMLLPLLWLLGLPAMATTWYVRPDGGTRYSSNVPNGQCDGMGDAAYPGKGSNQHCAFNDIRFLWQDGSYAYAPPQSKFPAAGWIGQGGDTYLIRGSLQRGTAPYRVGWDGLENHACTPANKAKFGDACHRGWAGDPYTGPPTPPAGTAAQHTRILGENWQTCHSELARTPVVSGWMTTAAFTFSTSYVDFQCFDISDASDCVTGCKDQDAGGSGIGLFNTADHLLLQDVRVHGLSNFGIYGPSGDGDVFRYLSIVGNGGGGWSADRNDGTTGTGKLLVQHYEILWNGCAEEYPIKDRLPYKTCRDQNSAGYGDGFGTATVVSNPGWQAHFDQGEVAYNTQDGLDALHLNGNGSSITVTRTLAYGNMGQQIKIGGAAGAAVNNVIVGNCRALAGNIPGTPARFNAQLSDFCRAGDSAVALTVGRGVLTRFESNTLYEAGTIGVDVECDTTLGTCDNTARISLQNNIFIGFANGPKNGDKDGDGRLPTAFYNNTGAHPFTNRGSAVRNNTVWHQRTTDACPMGRFDRAAVCASPMLRDQTWHLYGYGDMRPMPGGKSVGSGVAIPGVDVDFSGAARPKPPSRGALEPGSTAPASGLQDSSTGDAAGGGGGALPALHVEPGEVFSPSDEIKSTDPEALVRVPHHLLRRAALCTLAAGAGVSLFLMGRASASRGTREQI